MTQLTVVVVNWNTRELLRACLDSLENNLISKVRCEVIVVDNASSDGSSDMVKADFPDVRLIENAENQGFVRANNQAVSIARGKYLLLLNSDTRLIGDDTQSILDYMEANPLVGIVTGKVYFENGQFQCPYYAFPGLFHTVIQHTFLRVIELSPILTGKNRYDDLDPETPHVVDWVTGAYLYLRRELLDGGKVFDEALFMYYEDTLLCKRAWDMGYKVMYLPLAPIVHHHHVSGKKVPSLTALRSFNSSLVYVDRMYNPSVSRLYRGTVRQIWNLLRAVFWLLPFEKTRRKYEMFHYLYSTEGGS